jgi:hypothetical protein
MLELVMERLEMLGADVSVDAREGVIDVVVEDFEGFDDEGEEIFLDYDSEAIEDFEEWLKEHCLKYCEDFYQYYHFEDFQVIIGYASFDI